MSGWIVAMIGGALGWALSGGGIHYYHARFWVILTLVICLMVAS